MKTGRLENEVYNVLKTYGDGSIRFILLVLEAKKVIPDIGPASRKKVVAVLNSNPKFARGHAGSSYTLRLRAKKAA
jgi:hypothetical protein